MNLLSPSLKLFVTTHTHTHTYIYIYISSFEKEKYLCHGNSRHCILSVFLNSIAHAYKKLFHRILITIFGVLYQLWGRYCYKSFHLLFFCKQLQWLRGSVYIYATKFAQNEILLMHTLVSEIILIKN